MGHGATGGAGATPMWEADFAGGVAIVLGAEGRGFARSSAHVRRPRLDPLAGQVESLNVSVAAAVLL